MRLVGADSESPEHDAYATSFGLTRMIKIEAVVDSGDESAVREVLLGGGATGYTALSGVSGFGHHGHHQGKLLFNDRASLSMVICVVPPDRAEPVVSGIRRLFEHHHGVLFVSETYVSRPEYFSNSAPED